jgi:hypothetical protein
MAFKLRSQKDTANNGGRVSMAENLEKTKLKSSSTLNSLKVWKDPRTTLMQDFQKWGEKNPKKKALIQILDPTGKTSHEDAKKAWSDGKLNSEDAMAALSVIPVFGKLAKLGKLEKATSSYLKTQKILKGTRAANKVSDAGDATTIVK